MEKKRFYIIVLACFFITFVSNVSAEDKENFIYEINGCNKGNPFGEADLELQQVDNGLEFILRDGRNCIIQENEDALKLKCSISGNNIEIREIFESTIEALCSCMFEIKGQILNLAQGNYHIKFVYKDAVTGSEGITMERDFEIK